MNNPRNGTSVDNKTNVRQAVRLALLLGSTALAGSFMLAGQAIAQDQVAAVDEAEELEEVIVTGSRLTRSGFESATPMDVINVREGVELGYVDVADMLMSSPALAGSDQMTSVMSGILGANGGEGVQTADIRGLGAERTLSLLNGRRAGPAGIRDGVTAFDINVIPVSALERVEILKDGASSIYGSDAIGGVINYITRKGDGGEINAYTQFAEESGGEILQINGSYGRESDKGYWRVTADYNKQEQILKGDREIFDCEQEYVFNESGLKTRADVINPLTDDYKCQGFDAGSMWIYDYHQYTYYYYYQDAISNVQRIDTRVVYDYDGSIAASGLLPDRNNGADSPGDLRVPEGWYILPVGAAGDRFIPYSTDYNEQTVMVPERERFTLMANGEYEVSDNMTLYGEVLFNRRETHHEALDQLWTYNYTSNYGLQVFDPDDPCIGYSCWNYSGDDYTYYYVDVGAGDPESVGWTGAQLLDPIIAYPSGGKVSKVDYTRIVLGALGDIGDSDWSYDISLQHSYSNGEYIDQGVYADAQHASTNRMPYWYGTHMGLCAGTTFDRLGPNGEIREADIPCVDINHLDPYTLRGEYTQEQEDFLFLTERGSTDYKNESFDVGFVNNELFSMPAGKVGLAAGLQYMTDEIADWPGIESRSGNVWDGSTGWANNSGAKQYATIGETDTQAVYLETAIPLLANKPGFDFLELNASARYTKVSINETEDSDARDFSDTTYKVGLNWTINDSFRVRAGRGTSFRTPALFELYRKNFHSYPAQNNTDPCWEWGIALANNDIEQHVADNCAAEGIPDNIHSLIPVDVVTGGGAAVLEAETSISESIGLIWTAKNIDLRVSVDYFDVEVDDEIGTFEAVDIVEGCYEADNFPGDQLCSLIEREAPGVPIEQYRVTTVQASYINLDLQRTSGWDIEASYAVSLPNNYDLSINTAHTITDVKEKESAEGVISSRAGRAGNPKWVGNLTVRLSKGPWSAAWRANYVDGTDNNREGVATSGTWIGLSGEEETFYYSRKLDSRIYHNASATYAFGDGWEANLSITNITDKLPPRATQGAGPAAVRIEGYGAFHSQYDWKGRRYGLNIKKTF
jgi:iron complex outermembrane receptor protein